MAKFPEKDGKKDRPDSSSVSPASSSSSATATATAPGAKPAPVADAKPALQGAGASGAPVGSGAAKAASAAGPAKPVMKETPKSDPARDSALNRAVQQIEKQFGKGSVMKLEGTARVSADGIPTGSLSLDIALGGVGVPRGRILEIFGPESSGKTTLCLHIVASAQKLGGVAAFIDAEHALDPSWAKRLGVQLDDLLVSQPDTGEQALEICELLVRSNAVDVIVIDSVAALIPRAEIEGEMGDSHVGLQARLMSQAMRKLTAAIAKSRTTVIFINQIREKIGVMFGNPETTPGGRALKFYASVRIDVRRTQTIKEAEVSIGARTRARVVKNKIAPPFRDAEFDIMFDRGISYEGDLIDLAVTCNVVEKSGAWYNYKTTRLGQGRENSKQFLFENKDLAAEIRQAVLVSKGMLGDAKQSAESSGTAEAGA
ncbi:MAG: recombination protein RecA [Phycisphaerales bacterium]|nr:recombination protein RecA [Phycisphaerales bacterium]